MSRLDRPAPTRRMISRSRWVSPSPLAWRPGTAAAGSEAPSFRNEVWILGRKATDACRNESVSELSAAWLQPCARLLSVELPGQLPIGIEARPPTKSSTTSRQPVRRELPPAPHYSRGRERRELRTQPRPLHSPEAEPLTAALRDTDQGRQGPSPRGRRLRRNEGRIRSRPPPGAVLPRSARPEGDP